MVEKQFLSKSLTEFYRFGHIITVDSLLQNRLFYFDYA